MEAVVGKTIIGRIKLAVLTGKHDEWRYPSGQQRSR
jgi:hypothetical protein